MGIETLHEAHVYMRADCHVCRSEGFSSQNSVLVTHGGKSIVATLYVVAADMLGQGEIGLSEYPWAKLKLKPGNAVTVSHPPPLESFSHVRSKVYGHRLGDHAFKEIITDIATGPLPEHRPVGLHHDLRGQLARPRRDDRADARHGGCGRAHRLGPHADRRQALRGRAARQPHDAAGGRHRRGGRADDSQDLQPRHHLAMPAPPT